MCFIKGEEVIIAQRERGFVDTGEGGCGDFWILLKGIFEFFAAFVGYSER